MLVYRVVIAWLVIGIIILEFAERGNSKLCLRPQAIVLGGCRTNVNIPASADGCQNMRLVSCVMASFRTRKGSHFSAIAWVERGSCRVTAFGKLGMCFREGTGIEQRIDNCS